MIGLGVAHARPQRSRRRRGAVQEGDAARPAQGDSYYNLGVLYKDFRANKQNDPDPIKALRASQDVYKQARDFFNQFLDKDGDPGDKAEAKNNIADCDKVVKQLDNAIIEPAERSAADPDADASGRDRPRVPLRRRAGTAAAAPAKPAGK